MYVNHTARQNNGNRRPHPANTPDTHAMNSPAGKQRIHVSSSSREIEAIFEVNIFTACKSRYAHKSTKATPVDRGARVVVNSYDREFKHWI